MRGGSLAWSSVEKWRYVFGRLMSVLSPWVTAPDVGHRAPELSLAAWRRAQVRLGGRETPFGRPSFPGRPMSPAG